MQRKQSKPKPPKSTCTTENVQDAYFRYFRPRDYTPAWREVHRTAPDTTVKVIYLEANERRDAYYAGLRRKYSAYKTKD